jgi:hypothetical protein
LRWAESTANLLLRAGERGLGGGNVRIGFLCVGGDLEALTRRPSVAGELSIARVIERRAKPLGLGALERGAGLIDGIALLDQILVDSGGIP